MNAIVVDMGGTTTRVGLFHGGGLQGSVVRFATPKRTDNSIRSAHLDRIADELTRLRREQPELDPREVGVAVGATIDAAGRIRNASMLWGESSTGFDLGTALRERLPWADVALINDIAAAAWRYQELGRFALVTVSTGIAVKVFDDALPFPAKLILDDDGLGGEIGHVYTGTDGDGTVRCECGNAGDLCSYSSGPATVRAAVRRADQFPSCWRESVLHTLCEGKADRITAHALAQAARSGDDFAAQILYAATRPLAVMILQTSALLGLRRFVIMGGFAHGVGVPWFAALRANLGDLLPGGGWFTGWTDADLDALVLPSEADDNDSLVGMGRFLAARRTQVRELHKPVGETRTVVRHFTRPRCGREQLAAGIVFAGICGTDLQILRGERGCEPGVLGHECVAEVVEAGQDVRGLDVGQMVALNPNHPYDEHEKIGHNQPGILRDLAIWDQHMIDRGQLISLPGPGSAELVLLEPLACVVRSLLVGRSDWKGRRILVIGAGVSGLLHVMLARRWQAERVLLANRGTRRLRSATARGLLQESDCVVFDENWRTSMDAATGGFLLDGVVIAVSGGGPSFTESLWPYLADGATVHLFGGFAPDAVIRTPGGGELAAQPIRSGAQQTVDLPAGRRCTLVGSRGAGAEEFRAALGILSAEQPPEPPFGSLISHVVSLDVAPAVLDELARTGCVHGDPALRVVVDLRLRGRLVQPAHLTEHTKEFP